jgi:hypothetical protein
LDNEELHDLYSVLLLGSLKKCCDWINMLEYCERNAYTILFGQPNESRTLGRMKWKYILRKPVKV